mmetsp:Transcript_4396/g.16586  ORF Transcript_4396/g.16586 Transcript_4396/m.16586 type:complete len:230 (-) Transcript_4396:606-1295(-)
MLLHIPRDAVESSPVSRVLLLSNLFRELHFERSPNGSEFPLRGGQFWPFEGGWIPQCARVGNDGIWIFYERNLFGIIFVHWNFACGAQHCTSPSAKTGVASSVHLAQCVYDITSRFWIRFTTRGAGSNWIWSHSDGLCYSGTRAASVSLTTAALLFPTWTPHIGSGHFIEHRILTSSRKWIARSESYAFVDPPGELFGDSLHLPRKLQGTSAVVYDGSCSSICASFGRI